MKSDPRAVPFRDQGPAADAFEAFFEMVEAPAALCDLQLTVLKANASFEVLAGAKHLEGQPLERFLDQGALEVPGDGSTQELDVLCRTGQEVKLTFTRRGQTVAVVARRLSPMLDSLAAAGKALLEQARTEAQLLEIGRHVAGATSEEELVATVARGVKELFPGRTFAVRIVDPRSGALTSLYAEGRLRDGRRDQFHLRRSMVEKTHLDVSRVNPQQLVVTAGELPPLFHGTVRCVAAPLVASGQLFGAIHVEYPAGLTADVLGDERVLIQLTNQVSVAVRNAKLIDELSFMRKYLEELLENANALILVANREGKVVVFNGALVRLTGFSKAEVLGKELVRLVPEAERLQLLRILDAPLKGESTSGQEVYLSTRDGRQMRVSFATSSALSQTGEVDGAIFIGQDLTRTRELERRIIQAEKLASLGQLAASVVHEINNPMTAVATYADALLKRSMLSPRADPADVEKYRRIVDNAERVLRFTRDLVSYARPAQEKPEEVDLNQLVERAAGFCDHVLAKHDVTLETHLAPLPRFQAVRQNVVQVFVNLITNACHATPAGGKVVVTTARAGDAAVAEVSDTGAGIEPGLLPRVFEPFVTTKADGKGTGLGLSIVQGIVESHGGTVGVVSEVGKGTTFTVRLPLLGAAGG